MFNKKKMLVSFVAAVMALSVLSGCGKNESKENNKTSETTSATTVQESPQPGQDSNENENLKAPVEGAPFNIKETGATENMLIRSILREGNQARIASKIQYAIDNPKEMTNIVYLGDSITAGSSASSSNQYTNQFTRWWEDNVSYFAKPVNAGIGATDTYLAVHRAERDVLSQDPDIIFIEFINDADTDFYKKAMESLVRKCLAYESQPAVILVEMTMEDGTCPQRVHTQIAEHYDLPVISYHDAVLPEITAGNFTWRDISPDNIHPNDAGHKLLGQLLSNYIQSVKDNLANIDMTVTTELPEAITGDKYAEASVANRDTAEVTVTDEGAFTNKPSFYQNFTNGWGTTTGGSITFEVEAKNLGMVYNKNVDGTFGMVEIYVDGEKIKTIDADFTGGWGSYACMEEFYQSDEKAKHTVTITVADTGKTNFDIYSLLIS